MFYCSVWFSKNSTYHWYDLGLNYKWGVFTGITNIDYTNNSFENLFTGTSKIIEKKYTPV